MCIGVFMNRKSKEEKIISEQKIVEEGTVSVPAFPMAKKTDAVQTPITRTMALVPVDPQALLAQAIERGLPLESMERLLAMRRELKAEWSRERFFADLAKFQAACPVIGKSRGVNDKYGKLRYKFAPLDEIVEQVKKPLEEYGFSYTIITKQTDQAVTAICNAHHVDGHTESSEFTIPIDPEAYMNDAQKIASAMTYATRYAFRNAFGIVTGDMDDDGIASGENGGGRTEQKTDLRPPQTLPVGQPAIQKSKTGDVIQPSIQFVEGQPLTGDPYAEVMTILNTKEKSKEGPMVALFSSPEKVSWKARVDKAKGKPEELLGALQELDEISGQRRARIKEKV